MKKFTIYLGLNDKETKQQKISTIEAFKIVSNLIASRFDGGTIFEADGVYKHENGTFVIEKTLRIELLFVDRPAIVEFEKVLKVIFNQETIAVQEETICSELM